MSAALGARVGVLGQRVGCPIPLPEEVQIIDIAHALSQINRFGGWLYEPLSVAQHSVEVSLICEERALVHGLSASAARQVGLAGLLHDAHEAYIGDVITPIKRMLGEPMAEMDRRAVLAVHTALGTVDLMSTAEEHVTWADREMRVSDIARFGFPNASVTTMTGECIALHGNTPPPPHILRFPMRSPTPWRLARGEFIRRYEALTR